MSFVRGVSQEEREVVAQLMELEEEEDISDERRESSRMRAVVYLKPGTRQAKAPHITQTKNCSYHRLEAVHKTDKNARP